MSKDRDYITGRLNVDDFVDARKTDISKLEKALSNSGNKTKKRAFQSLPRTERRRAASHDPKRVPRKNGLRKRAELEAIRDNSKLVIRRRVKKPRLSAFSRTLTDDSEGIVEKPRLRYADRQRDKSWLPTHIWHKKRAHMIMLDKFLVPFSASQKQFRRSYRMSQHIDEKGAMAWDMSYVCTIAISGASGTLAEAASEHFPGCTSPLVKSGIKQWQGLSEVGFPALVFWADENLMIIQFNPLGRDGLLEKLGNDERLNIHDWSSRLGAIDLIGRDKIKIFMDLVKPVDLSMESQKLWELITNEYILPYRMVLRGKFESSQFESASSRIPGQASRSSLSEESGDREKAASNSAEVTICLLDDERTRIIMPRSWVLPMWLQIFKKRSVLIGGQLELSQLALELGCPFFPKDFVHFEIAANYCNQLANFSTASSKHLKDFLWSYREEHRNHSQARIRLRGGRIPKRGDIVVLNGNDSVGIVTSGNFSYRNGEGSGICICLSKLFIVRKRISAYVIQHGTQYPATLDLIHEPAKVM